jgi:hypothetical protein
MAREIPEVVRAAAGLAATVLDEARKLPETLPGLPVRLIGLAMQQAMKVQQQYAGFVARGDELFTGLRGENEPGLATFDDDVPPLAPAGFRDSAFDRAGDTEPTNASADLIIDEEVADDAAADAVVEAAVEELAVAELGEQIDAAQQSIDVLAEEAPDTEAILDEIAIDELVDQAPTLEETAPTVKAAPRATKAAAKKASAKKAPEDKAPAKKAASKKAAAKKAPAKKAAAGTPATAPASPAASGAEDAAVTEDPAALESALLEAAIAAPGASGAADSPTAEPSAPDTIAPDTIAPDTTDADTIDAVPTADVATTVDVLTPAGDVEAVEATVTDEGVAAPETTQDVAPVAVPEAPADDAASEGERGTATAESTPPTDEPQGGSDTSGSQAAGTAPIEGYDGFSIAQLRGRMRGYALSTVQDLIAYEEATRARAPYLTMLRNRLEKLEEQAIESSPLAPRGA